MAGTLNKGTLNKGSLVKGTGGNGGGGGGGGTTGEYFVKVIDYDGTVIDEQWLDDGAEYTLPANPDRTDKGLVFQEWSSSETITDGKITIDKNNVMVGAIYTTSSGYNEFDIVLDDTTGLSVTVKMSGTKDWGDGSATDSTTAHTYTEKGKYTIKCYGKTMSSISYSSGFFGQGSSSHNKYCVAIRFAEVTVAQYAFDYLDNVKYISLSNKVTISSTYPFSSNNKLQTFIIPKHITTIQNSFIQSAITLKSLVIPNTVTTVGANAFQYLYLLEDLVLPNSVTSVAGSSFANLYSAKKISLPSSLATTGDGSFASCYSANGTVIVPKTLTTITSNCFSNWFSVSEYDFTQFEAIPTLQGVNAFLNKDFDCKFKVPSALYEQWITETNWATYADYIVAV